MTRLLIIPGALLLFACAEPSKVKKPRSEMTELERDSTIAESGLPGSGVVKRGLKLRSVEAAHAAALDSAGNEN
jgi:hypothetical protein